MNLDSQTVEIVNRQPMGQSQLKLENNKFFNKKSVIMYSGAFVALVAFVASGMIKTAPEVANAVANEKTAEPIASNVALVDKVSEANVVASLAETANLPVINTAVQTSMSLSTMQEIAQIEDLAVTSPKINDVVMRERGITDYEVQEGDTAQSIGEKYGISAQTIKWVNNIRSDVKAGDTIKILPVDGIVYTVKDGDSLESISEKYEADVEMITTYNDLELSGVEKDMVIIVPSGILPETERPDYVAPVVAVASTYNYGGRAAANVFASSGNRYAYGYCTFYVYERRPDIGSFWGNATSWAASARAAGYLVNATPAAGAIMQNGGGYGHVSYVESINPGVSITISEMNGYRFGGGWNRIGSGEISWAEAVSGGYQYIH